MAVIETSSERLHLQFRDEPGSQLLLGLVFTLGIIAFAFLERTSCGCLADRAAGRFTIFRVNGLGLTLRISCNQGDIRTIEVRRRVSGRGRPCSASVILRSGRQLRLLSYKSCAEQRQIVNQLVSFLGI